MQVALLQKVKCNNAEETRIQMKTNVPIQTDTPTAANISTHTYIHTQTHKYIYNKQWQSIFYLASLSHSPVNFSCFVWIESSTNCISLTAPQRQDSRQQHKAACVYCILLHLTLLSVVYLASFFFFLPSDAWRTRSAVSEQEFYRELGFGEKENLER